MTPSAMTSAGRKATAAASQVGSTSARTAHPRPVRAAAAAAAPAPWTARAGASHAPRPARTSRPARTNVPRGPRRISGPVRPRRPVAQQPPSRRLARAAVEFVRALPDHRWLERLVSGRAWIPVLGVLLAGIVATQVEVLKLGASMGRWMERSAALSSHNQSLQASVAALSDDQRIERLAARMGMVMPAPTAVTFLSHRPPGGVRAAVARIHAPDPAQFVASLQAAAAAASATSPVLPPAAGTSATPTTIGASAGAPASTTAQSNGG